MDTEDIKELLEIIGEFKPAASEIVGVIQQYGPEVKQLLNGIIDGACELTCRTFANYMSSGFSREEAFLLLIDGRLALKMAMDRVNVSKQ